MTLGHTYLSPSIITRWVFNVSLFSKKALFCGILSQRAQRWGKKNNNKYKDFWRDTPWCVVPSVPWTCPICPVVCPVCPTDIPALGFEFPHKSGQTSWVSLGHPEFILGTLRGIPTTKFLYVIYIYGFFFLHERLNKYHSRSIACKNHSPTHEKHYRLKCSLLVCVREVLNGVGADGVGVKFPIFPVNCSYLPLVLGQSAKSEEKRQKRGYSRKKSEEKRKKAKKKGRFPPAPSTPTPLRTSQ